jgi:hypothetical protein
MPPCNNFEDELLVAFINSPLSNTVTSAPLQDSCQAQHNPFTPPPITAIRGLLAIIP